MIEKTTHPWTERVRQADAEAEEQWSWLTKISDNQQVIAQALVAIAAELRAQRIARRPGAGR